MELSFLWFVSCNNCEFNFSYLVFYVIESNIEIISLFIIRKIGSFEK